MCLSVTSALLSFLLATRFLHLASASRLNLGAQAINLWKLGQPQNSNTPRSTHLLAPRNTSEFVAQWFTQPLDHFDKSNTATFLQRYWVNKRHYQSGSGGPVIVLDGGETSGTDRLPYLDTGIVEILANATGGLGVVLEHRYYGKSVAVANLTTDSLRWLNNDQAAADSANFLANVRFDGIDEDLSAPNTPWIYYGGSYAGARSAHMKILYPDLVYGAIASSGVTHAAITNWEYMDVIRKAADPICSSNLQNSVRTIDSILAHNKSSEAQALRSLFGLANITHDEDFVSLLTSPIGDWQSKNWDPAVGSNGFDEFCEALNTPPNGTVNAISERPYNDSRRLVLLEDGSAVDFVVANYAQYIKKNLISQCTGGATVDECFGTFDASQYQATTLNQTWRLWQFQVCTQWGYFTTAPPDPHYPRIISSLLTLPYESMICRQAYPPGEHFQVPPLPDITAVNVLGDFAIAADRLAIIDGQVDPWRPDTPHSQYGARPRPDTILRPFKLIPNAVHHYDENGLPDIRDEPPEIRKIHEEEINFVTLWLEDFKKERK